ncbi:hypothetical protein [Paraburkholderia fungorum]|jgi:hypothetical protein|uniref:hypothetical protein n=1 Tax=Paraburkholderia fungorum TaxID=134537 RepID=UPI000D084C63|nr:hypothetical protein [Paraburkholderia fungorum]PRZ45390.1 hypothetical protein BX589_13969 [Paraburkholderia fungorum]
MFDFNMEIHEPRRTFIDGIGNEVVVLAVKEDEFTSFEVFLGTEGQDDAHIIGIIFPDTTASLNAHLEFVVSDYMGQLPSHMTGYFADEMSTLRLIEQSHREKCFGRKGDVLNELVRILRERWTIAEVPGTRSTHDLKQRFEHIEPDLKSYGLAADLDSLAQFCSGVTPAPFPFIGFRLLDAVVADIRKPQRTKPIKK